MDVEISVVSNSDDVKQELSDRIQAALTAIGLKAESYAKDLCPVDTGRLRNSITNANDGESVYIGTNVEYAAFVEIGTTKMKPRPYLRPAATEHTEEYRQIMESALKSED